MVAVDAAIAVKIDQLGLVGAAGFKKVKVQDLALLFGVNYADRGVDLFSESFDGIDLAVIAYRALHVIVIGRVEVFLDHISCECDLANARSTDLAVR